MRDGGMGESHIKIFKDELFAESSTEKQMQMLGVLCYLLAQALSVGNKRFARIILKQASKFGKPLKCRAFDMLLSAAASEVNRKFK